MIHRMLQQQKKKIRFFFDLFFSPFFLVFIEPNYTANFLLIMFNLCISIAILLKSPLWLNMKSCTCEFHQWFRTVALEVRNLPQKLCYSFHKFCSSNLFASSSKIYYVSSFNVQQFHLSNTHSQTKNSYRTPIFLANLTVVQRHYVQYLRTGASHAV